MIFKIACMHIIDQGELIEDSINSLRAIFVLAKERQQQIEGMELDSHREVN